MKSICIVYADGVTVILFADKLMDTLEPDMLGVLLIIAVELYEDANTRTLAFV